VRRSRVAGRIYLMSDWNDQIIAEFRGNQGKVGGNFAGRPMLLLHTVGRR